MSKSLKCNAIKNVLKYVFKSGVNYGVNVCMGRGVPTYDRCQDFTHLVHALKVFITIMRVGFI